MRDRQDQKIHKIEPFAFINSKAEGLHQFKNQIEVSRNHPKFRPYTAAKSSVSIYRTIFLGFGALYFMLGMILSFKSLTWTCGLIFGSCFGVKVVLFSVCALISSVSITLGFTMKTEKEAVKKLFNDAKKRLKKLYEKKLVHFEVQSHFAFGKEYRKTLAFKQQYQEALDKLSDQKEETFHLIERIAKSYDLDGEMQEELFNQALLEFRQRADEQLVAFSESNPPKHLQYAS